jgi:N6-adenosine-specific RNA methylase IME4
MEPDMARPPIKKAGRMTATEYQRRWRAKVRRRQEAEPKLAKLRQKQQRRAEREQLLGAEQLALPDQKFGVIVEDYEWDYEVWSRETGMDRHAANHYPVSQDAHTAEEIVERTQDRFACAADNCVLFMWTTVPHLAVAIDVLRQRGFRYVSNYAWGKDRAGTGHWNRNKHEHLLIGVRGSVPAPAPGTQWDSLILAAAGEHSAKPERFLDMIEGYFPSLPKIELNRRGPPRPGWWAWGNEAI